MKTKGCRWAMLIINFLKKKTTILYIIIIALLLLLIPLFKYMSNKRITYYNEIYQDTYIEFLMSYEEYERISNIKEIENITLGFEADLGTVRDLRFFEDPNLANNELILDENYFKNYHLGDTITLFNYDFKLIDETYSLFNDNHISEYALNELKDNFDTLIYRVTLNDWSKASKVEREINKGYPFEQGYFIETYFDHDKPIIYDIFYYIIKLILIILSLYIIFNICFNIYLNEKEKSYLYYALGFTKKQLLLISITKYILVFTLGFLLNLLFILIL